jgi:hypothetical protein
VKWREVAIDSTGGVEEGQPPGDGLCVSLHISTSDVGIARLRGAAYDNVLRLGLQCSLYEVIADVLAVIEAVGE